MAGPITLRTDAGDEDLDIVEFEARVTQGEISPQSLVRLPAVTGDTFRPACELELYQRLHQPRRAYFRRAFSLNRFPWLTSGLILINVAVFLATAQNGELTLDLMVRDGAKVAPLIFDLGEVWRLFTANFLHHDALHIGLNMFVLFNVGNVLENTYRTLDYVWLLVFTGIATMGTSLFLNDAVTVGASGMVFGCLGGVLAFGLRYRNQLPPLYRSLLSDAAIPTVLGLLLIGITSQGVDNWAHLGGLGAGIVTGAFMRPRLLADARRFWWEPALRAAPSLAILTVVFLGQPMFFGQFLPRWRTERSEAFGLTMPVPADWSAGANPMGSEAWYNGLSSTGRASFAAEALEMPEGADVHEAARRFVENRLKPRELGEDVLSVQVEPAEAWRVGDRDGLRLKVTVRETTGNRKLHVYFVPRGTVVYQLAAEWSASFPKYAQVTEWMVQGLRLTEPAALRQVRAEALLFPNSPDALARLGLALLEQGEGPAAADALAAAVRGAPAIVPYRVALARAWLVSGEVERACLASEAALTYAPDDAQALEADARCELARGHPQRALERLGQARAAAPGDERLRDAESKLRATLPELR
ncbi:MAG: rhomboid family intramembrane serine protease [Myxococcaceae bacterium]